MCYLLHMQRGSLTEVCKYASACTLAHIDPAASHVIPQQPHHQHRGAGGLDVPQLRDPAGVVPRPRGPGAGRPNPPPPPGRAQSQIYDTRRWKFFVVSILSSLFTQASPLYE